ncbi:anti-sigma factor [Antrihabitans cavernicola]|uniref:Regulator of SigK n=1 Tax=Antrihabitans cavernicola TaxID=2495913 RepID=A0A5A7S5S1_9NOCA|nr:anti-sigma factor [Spelaeibacter cavernicola]KAA0017076.1 anti-sigma factor [Spelaeibacter cavernicola]
MNDKRDKAIDLADRGLLSLAYAYALDAIGDVERTDIEARLQAAPPRTRQEFERAVAEVRETMARAASAATTTPPAALRPRILDAVDRECHDFRTEEAADGIQLPRLAEHRTAKKLRWRFAAAAAVAAVAVGVAGAIPKIADSGGETEQVLVARDSHTVTSDFIGGGTATVTYSHEQNAAVVRFDGISAPAVGTTYQMWLFDGPAHSAGIVSAADLAADNRRVVENIGNATAFAVTIEQAGGSNVPTGNPIATVSLT